MIRRSGVLLTTTLAAGVLSLAVALPALAAPKNDHTPPPSGDVRATSFPDNATTCKEAGLDGSIILKDDKPTTQYIDITVPDGYVLTGTVVKGGDGYNVYPPSATTQLHAPLVGKPGNVPIISHWFACGIKKDTSSSSSKPPTSSSASSSKLPTSSSSSSSSSAANVPTTTTPAAQGGVSNESLASTGFSATAPLVGAGALILLGGGLLLALRRTRRRQ